MSPIRRQISPSQKSTPRLANSILSVESTTKVRSSLHSMASSFSIPCGYCQKKFKSSAELRRHHAERPRICLKYNHCTTESGCYMCSESGEHQWKAASEPPSNSQCQFCNTEWNSLAELQRHHTDRPIFCATRISCTTVHGCYLCGGEGVHRRKDNGQNWKFESFDVWS